MSKSAYDEAKSGGDNHGFFRRYQREGDRQIEKAMRSLLRQVDEHGEKIRNVEALRGQISDERIDSLRRYKWPTEIRVFRAQIDILREILKERKNG